MEIFDRPDEESGRRAAFIQSMMEQDGMTRAMAEVSWKLRMTEDMDRRAALMVELQQLRAETREVSGE